MIQCHLINYSRELNKMKQEILQIFDVMSLILRRKEEIFQLKRQSECQGNLIKKEQP